jgi:hypothetical protein
LTPASSKASRAAASASVRRASGQPLGITQRFVSRLLMSRTLSLPLEPRRQQSAATWRFGRRPAPWPATAAAALRLDFISGFLAMRVSVLPWVAGARRLGPPSYARGRGGNHDLRPGLGGARPGC